MNGLSLYVRAERKVVQVVLDTSLPYPFPDCFYVTVLNSHTATSFNKKPKTLTCLDQLSYLAIVREHFFSHEQIQNGIIFKPQSFWGVSTAAQV